MKLPISLLLSLPTLACWADVSVTVNTNAGSRYLDSTGQPLAVGSAIRVGTFDLAGGNLTTVQTSNDYNEVDALFTPISGSFALNDHIGTGQVFVIADGISASALPAGTPLYVWVFNESDPTQAGEWGIFRSSSPLWQFPNDGGSAVLTTTLVVDDILRGAINGSDLALDAIDVIVDTDGDGMPDDWEILYGFDPTDPSDAMLDFDLDGTPNLGEFYLMTNPTESTSRITLKILGLSPADEWILSYGPIVPDLPFLLQFKAHGPGQSWTTIDAYTPAPGENGAFIEVEHDDGGDPGPQGGLFRVALDFPLPPTP